MGSYVLVWNAIPIQYTDVIDQVERLRYDHEEYTGADIKKLEDGDCVLWTVRKQRKNAVSFDFLVRSTVFQDGKKSSVPAIRSELAISSTLPWKVTQHIDGSSFVAEGKVSKKDQEVNKVQLSLCDLIHGKPQDGSTGWIPCTADGKRNSDVAKNGRSDQAARKAVEYHEQDVIRKTEVYDKEISMRFDIEETDTVVFPSSDDGDNIIYSYAVVKGRETVNMEDIITLDFPVPRKIIASLVTPVLFVVDTRLDRLIIVSDIEDGSMCSIEGLTDEKCLEMKKLVDVDSMCVMIMFTDETLHRQFYEELAKRCGSRKRKASSQETSSSRKEPPSQEED